MQRQDYALKVCTLCKQFSTSKGVFNAVNGVSFSIKEGEIVGLLGVNGAGKSTTIQMLIGALTPTSGSISYHGKDFQAHRSEILERVGYVSGYSRMPWNLTIWENLEVHGMLCGLRKSDRRSRMKELLTFFGMYQQKDKLFHTLSAGQATRVALAKAFLAKPSVVLLDEPTASLDPEICEEIRSFVIEQKRKEGTAMLYTSHNMSEVAEVCDRIVFLKAGKIIAEDTPEGLARLGSETTLRLQFLQESEALAALKDISSRARVSGSWMEVRTSHQEVSIILEQLTYRGIRFNDIEIVKPSLEDFFIKVAREEVTYELV